MPLLTAAPQRAREESDSVARDLQERLWDAEQRCRTALVERDELMRRYDEAVQRLSNVSSNGGGGGVVTSSPGLSGEQGGVAAGGTGRGRMAAALEDDSSTSDGRDNLGVAEGEQADGALSPTSLPYSPAPPPYTFICEEAPEVAEVADDDVDSLLSSLAIAEEAERKLGPKSASSRGGGGGGMFGMLTGSRADASLSGWFP